MKAFYYLLCCMFLFAGNIHAQTACQWAYIPQAANSYNYAITASATDLQGNLVQVGKIVGAADMDPGSGSLEVSMSNPGGNIFLSKTSHSGHLLWIKYFTSPTYISFFEFKGVQVNSNNEIIVLGNFYGLVDFDLSPTGIDTLRSHFGTYPDYFLAKYDSYGNKIWVFNIGISTPNNIESHAMSIMPNNQILVAANPSSSPVDVDPGAAVHNSIGGNANIVCYSNDGLYLWNNNITTTSSYLSSYKCVDADNSLASYLLSVGYYELTVSKFSSTGARIWNKKIGLYPSSRVTPASVLVNKSNGDFYVAGTFSNTVDFDPNAAVVQRTASSASFEDGFIAKYDSSMNLIWVKNYAGNIVFGKFSLDFQGNDIVAVGRLKGNVDLGNGFVLNSSSATIHPVYVKIGSNGVTTEAYYLNGTGTFNTINCNSIQSYHTSGSVNTSIDMDPTTNVVTLTPGLSTNFTAMYGTLPLLSTTLQLKLYLQGYFINNGMMQSTLLNQGVSGIASVTDSVTIELHDSNSPYGLVRTVKAILNTDGTVTCNFTPLVNGNYFIVVKHRNSITTWSSTAINFGASNVSYDFTTSKQQSYGDNMIEVEAGKWAFYTGELNHDENIDLVDLNLLEFDIENFVFGYQSTDLNGDGNVDLLDNSVIDEGINGFIFSIHP